MADRVVVMYQGKKVEGTVHEIFNNPQHEYEVPIISGSKLGEMASKKYPNPCG